MDQAELFTLAKERMHNSCRICKTCNGITCAGELPGLGGIGTGNAFYRNWKSLQEYTVKDCNRDNRDFIPDTHVTLFGQKVSMPIISAPVGSIAVNVGIEEDTPENIEDQYMHALIRGADSVGVMAMIGDGPQSYSFAIGMKYANLYPGRIISIIKPRPDEVVIERGIMAKRLNEPAFGIDADASKLTLMKTRGLNIEHKSLKSLCRITEAVSLPFIVKGVMTVEEAIACEKSGVEAIVVGNHGGRILDTMEGAADVLPKIADALQGRMTILADGGIRSGEDVFKMLALGADAVLIGRPILFSVIGGGENGVKISFQQWQNELRKVMVRAGAENLKQITRQMVQKI